MAAVLALTHIKVTDTSIGWVLISSALALMIAGRVARLLSPSFITTTHEITITCSWIEVLVSFAMVSGIALLGPPFRANWRSRNALKQSEERFRTLVENLTVGVYRSTGDYEGRYLQVNPAMAKIFGYESPEQFIKIPIVDLYLDPEDRKKFIHKIRDMGHLRDEELTLRKKDGTPIKASVNAMVQYEEDGEIKWIDGITEDITERKLVEEKLRESELRLQSVLQSSPIPIFVIEKDHRVIYWNKALEELSGIKAEEVLGTRRAWSAFYSKERPVMAELLVDQTLEEIPNWYSDRFVKSSLLDEAYEATDFFPELRDGGKWLRFTAAAIRDSQGNLVGAIETLEDVTRQKRAEEELITRMKLESLGIFAGGIARDFNNMLSLILHNIFTARLSLADEQQEFCGEGLEIAQKVGLQAKELAHRLITFAKGGEPVRKIGSMAQLLMNTAGSSLYDSNVICRFSLPDDLWPIEMDELQIRQVIHNLVVNAREAMPEGGTMTIHAENVTVTASDGLPLKEGRYVRWSVKDHGIGIRREDLHRVFDPCFTFKPAGKPKGMGLGLPICYSIIKKHEGFIDVESEPGIGSTFSVYLPASPHDICSQTTEADLCKTKGGRVLLMDDDETVRNATGIVLNYLGYNVDYTNNGSDAISLYRAEQERGCPFFAVILGLDVPGGMGGKEAIKELLAIDPDIKAIISCGHSDDPVISEFRNYGFYGAIDVPYDIEKLKRLLDNLSECNSNEPSPETYCF
jgi:PAS domain S-box-containing protein